MFTIDLPILVAGPSEQRMRPSITPQRGPTGSATPPADDDGITEYPSAPERDRDLRAALHATADKLPVRHPHAPAD